MRREGGGGERGGDSGWRVAREQGWRKKRREIKNSTRRTLITLSHTFEYCPPPPASTRARVRTGSPPARLRERDQHLFCKTTKKRSPPP